MGIDIHRPFTLRVLNDDAEREQTGASSEAVAKTLAAVGTWTTRLWLADRRTAGMNRAITDLAHEPGPGNGEDFAQHWIDRIRRLRNTRVGVPNDEQVGEGIRTRQAYGASATQASFAILCALMESEHREESPPRSRLTIEHVMPQKLTDEWRAALGDEPEETHGRYRDRLANLTLSGDHTNAALGAKTFDAKKAVYRNSPIGMTRRLADEGTWNAAAIERRAEEVTRRTLEQWPWIERKTPEETSQSRATPLRWRIDGGEWRSESAASQMVLNVAGTLLGLDAANAERLSGEAISSNVHPTSRYPAGTRIGALTMRAIPGHAGYVLWPYAQDYRESADRCRKMGRRCDVQVEVEFEQDNQAHLFWRLFKTLTGGIPGQKDTWRGASQWTTPLNESGDRIGIYVGNADLLWLYIRTGQDQHSDVRIARARDLSWMIQDQMGDQELGDNLERNVVEGMTLTVQRHWNRDDEDEWPEAAQWVSDQQLRLQAILTEADDATDTMD